jgi:nucleoside 2-deoxyribosyltransferase
LASNLLFYIAGPLFTPAERGHLERVAAEVEAAGGRTYLPHRDGGLATPGRRSVEGLYEADVAALRKADAIVAVLDGSDVDSGTAFEIGFGAARAIPLFGIYQDLRIDDPRRDFNVMIAGSCRIVGGLADLRDQVQHLLAAR